LSVTSFGSWSVTVADAVVEERSNAPALVGSGRFPALYRLAWFHRRLAVFVSVEPETSGAASTTEAL